MILRNIKVILCSIYVFWKIMIFLFVNLSYEIVYEICIMMGFGYYVRIFKYEFV